MIKNIALFSWLSLLASIQASLLAWLVCARIPKSSPLAAVVLPEWQSLLRPEWEAEIFHGFIACACVIMGIWVWVKRTNLERSLWSTFKWRCAAETVLTVLMLSAAFQMVVYPDRPDLARSALIVLCVCAAVSKLWLVQIERGTRKLWRSLSQESARPFVRSFVYRFAFLLIIAIIAIPKPEAVVARFFVGEQFHHNDSFIMGPGWAFLSGNILDVDTISQYGIGFAAIISTICQKLLGGFSYVNVLNVLVGGTVIYFLVWFWMLRRIYASVGMALITVLIAIKWQMFHDGVFPFVFTYGSTTVWRGIMDVVMFAAIFAHLSTGRGWCMFLAAVAAGLGIYYLPSEGIYLATAFYAYWLCQLLNDRYGWVPFKSGLTFWGQWVACLILPPVVCWIGLWVTVGDHVWGNDFWHHMREFIGYFLSGFGAQPLTNNLTDRQFEREIFGFIIPAVYVVSLLITAGLAWAKRMDKNAFWLITLSIYGLSTYHYYVVRSTGTSYCAVILPFVWIIGFWLNQWVQTKGNKGFAIKAVGLGIAVWALATNHLFMAYPNVFNFSRNPMVDTRVALPAAGNMPYFDHLFRDTPEAAKVAVNSMNTKEEGLVEEKDFATDDALIAYYHQQSDFSQDAVLIQSLTGPKDKVALMSSFEIPMLMQANRRPYFYYFPLVISRPMGMRLFPAISIYTSEQLEYTLTQMEKDKPPFVFIERMLLAPEVPRYYLFRYPTTVLLLQYLRSHYAPFKEGQYLTACKRIDV